MSPDATHLTLMVLVDALRADYVSKTEYLKRLATQSSTGALRECFGFVPRAAYFGGLSVEQSGFTNMYCWDPAQSPFGVARYLPAGYDGLPEGWRHECRRFVETAARERLSPFAKAYAGIAEIPLPYLWYFDLVEKKAPWDRDVGYTSLFALLQERKLPWYQCSWPLTNSLPDHSDAGIVAQSLQDLRPEHRFAYVHLQELDAVGHIHGPGSSELLRRLQATDKLLEKLIESLRQRYQRLDVILFGDHGMVTVTNTVNLWELLEKTGLRFGEDYGYFLDSTMARFWFFHARAREIVEKTLHDAPGGRLLSASDLSHYGISKCDSRNAELIFLAHPGVLIFPNFFQNGGVPIKGMHGYDPDCPDNLGFFLLHSTSHPEWAEKNAGAVNPPSLFNLSRQLIGILPSTEPPLTDQLTAESRKGRFTAHPDPAADQMVAGHFDRIVNAVKKRCGEPQAVVLMGSFGRGEGGVFRDQQGRYRPVNDYDVIIITDQNWDAALKGLGGELAKELDIDYVDLSSSGGIWQNLPISVLNYDLKYGSQMLTGEQAILDRIPAYSAADIPIYEAIKLLLNRTAGLLTGLRGEFLAGVEPGPEQQRYLTNQVMKALMALGDSYLIGYGEYDSSYRNRAERLKWLAPGAGLNPNLVSQILSAYAFKTLPQYALGRWGLKEIAGFYPGMESALIQCINRLSGKSARNLPEAMTNYLQHMSADPAKRESENAGCFSNPALQPLLRGRNKMRVSIRHLVYSVLPFLVIGALDSTRFDSAIAEVRKGLMPVFLLPDAKGTRPEDLENLRKLVVDSWFAVCH